MKNPTGIIDFPDPTIEDRQQTSSKTGDSKYIDGSLLPHSLEHLEWVSVQNNILLQSCEGIHKSSVIQP